MIPGVLAVLSAQINQLNLLVVNEVLANCWGKQMRTNDSNQPSKPSKESTSSSTEIFRLELNMNFNSIVLQM